jgi:tetratricopeptide (TPR) repeat protein
MDPAPAGAPAAGLTQQKLLETAIHRMRDRDLVPRESSIESLFELVVGGRLGESVLRTRDDRAALKIGDVRDLRSIYPSPLEPLSVIQCGDRDLACFFDLSHAELVMEATSAGEERCVIFAGDDFCRHAVLGPEEGARISFAGLERKKTYVVGLVTMRSPDCLFEETERLYLRSLELDPADPVCWTNRGNALSALGREPEAREAYKEARRIAALHAEQD